MKRLLAALLIACVCTPVFAKGGSGGRGGFSGGGRSFSSGSKSFGGSRSFSSGSKPSSAGKSFSSGSKPSSSTPKFSSGSRGKSSSGFSNPKQTINTKAGKAASREASRTASQPKPSTKYFSSPKAKPQVHTDRIKKTVTHEHIVTHEHRASSFYGPSYTTYHPPVMYHDPFNSFLTTWLLTQSISDRASWAYNHRNEMDDARYREMISKDAALEARVKELEAKGAPRDPNYVPPGMKDNPDLMYSEDFVKAVHTEASPPAASTATKVIMAIVVFTILIVMILCIAHAVKD